MCPRKVSWQMRTWVGSDRAGWGVGLGQANCPLKEVSRNQARQMVGELLGYYKKNPNCDKSEHLKKKITEVKDK